MNSSFKHILPLHFSHTIFQTEGTQVFSLVYRGWMPSVNFWNWKYFQIHPQLQLSVCLFWLLHPTGPWHNISARPVSILLHLMHRTSITPPLRPLNSVSDFDIITSNPVFLLLSWNVHLPSLCILMLFLCNTYFSTCLHMEHASILVNTEYFNNMFAVSDKCIYSEILC